MQHAHINLDEKTPAELRTLLTLVQTGTLPYEEKSYWVKQINAKLNHKTLDREKAEQIYEQIEEGMADISDMGN